MVGSRSDSYLGGLFQTSSAGNMARRVKRRKQKKVSYLRWGSGIALAKKAPKPKKDTQLDRFAEHLAEGLSVREASEKMGLSYHTGNTMLARIRKRLGPQAV